MARLGKRSPELRCIELSGRNPSRHFGEASSQLRARQPECTVSLVVLRQESRNVTNGLKLPRRRTVCQASRLRAGRRERETLNGPPILSVCLCRCCLIGGHGSDPCSHASLRADKTSCQRRREQCGPPCYDPVAYFTDGKAVEEIRSTTAHKIRRSDLLLPVERQQGGVRHGT